MGNEGRGCMEFELLQRVLVNITAARDKESIIEETNYWAEIRAVHVSGERHKLSMLVQMVHGG